MKRIAVVENPRQAQAFIDYMASRGIGLSLAPEPEGRFAIWLNDAQHELEAEAEFNLFIANPYDQKYQAASWELAESRTAKFHYQHPSLLRIIKSGAGPATLAVMVASIIIYVLWWLGLHRPIMLALHFPVFVDDEWQLWRYVSHAFLHFSALHIIFNCLWWWVLGGQIEQHSGSGKLLQIFLFSALISGFGQYWLHGANFGGLSGVVYALLGYLWWMSWLAPERGLHIQRAYVGFMLAWLVIGFAQPFGMQIANMAHLFGLLSGCGFALIDAKLRASTS